jgi:hypothetical protein
MAVTGGLTEIIATTLRNRSGKLADNVSNNNALLKRLSTKGNIKPVSGGRTIVQEIEYAENGTYTRYSGYETLNISPSDVITGAEFDWKQAAVAVTMSGLEMLQNAGKEQQIDMLEARITNAERTFKNQISTDIYSDGTASGGKQIGGLQLLIADTGLSTVGGISSTTYSWWRNQVYDFSTAGVTPSSATIQTAMNTLFLQTARGTDTPDLIVADNTYYRYYWESLQSIQRITNENTAGAGFKALQFLGRDVVFDGGQDGAAPSSHMYFINSNYLYFRPHRERNMVPLESDRYATNQDAVVKLIGFAGNMTVANRALQGVIVA